MKIPSECAREPYWPREPADRPNPWILPRRYEDESRDTRDSINEALPRPHPENDSGEAGVETHHPVVIGIDYVGLQPQPPSDMLDEGSGIALH